MKILHLTFRNLNSLTGTFTIDFSEGPLAEAGIFAITGPTGAGKTTILDAITLGLFGKAARYDNSKPEDMMSRGTGECFAEVRFSCGNGTYSARWDLTRARKKPSGNLQPPKRQLADQTGTLLAEKIRDVDEKVTALTGLDYPRFLRSVLLAQGRFKEFLDAGVKDRGELLERITGTEIYSNLSILAHEAAREHEEAVREARTAANLITLLSEEEVEGFAREHHTLAEKKKRRDTELDELTKKLDTHEKWIQASKHKKALLQEERAWQERNSSFGPRRKDLERHDTAAPLSGDLKLWDAKNATQKKLQSQLTQLKNEHDSARQQTAEALAAAVAACSCQIRGIETRRTEGMKKKESLGAEIAAIQAWQKDHSADEGIEQALPALREKAVLCRSKAQALKDAEKATELTRQRITRLDREMKEAGLELAKTRKDLEGKEATLKKVEKALTAHKPKGEWVKKREAAEGVRAALQELARHNDTHAALLLEKETLLANQRAQQEEKSRLEGRITELAGALEIERRILGDKELIHSQATVMASLEERRSQLVPGEACPLCGATEHPYAAEELPKPSETRENLLSQKKKVTDLEKKEQASEKELASTAATLTGLNAQIQTTEKNTAELARRFSRIATELNIEATLGDGTHLQSLITKNSNLLAAIGETIKTIEGLEAEKNAAEIECIAAKGRAEACEGRITRLTEDLDRENTQLSAQAALQTALANETLATLEACMTALSPWGLSAETPDAAATHVAALEKRAKTWQTQRENLATARHTETKVDAGLETLALQIQRIEEERETWCLYAEPFGDLTPEAPTVPEALPDETARRALCDKAARALATVETRIKSTENELTHARDAADAFHVELSARLVERGFHSIEALKLALLDDERLQNHLREKEALASGKIRLETLIRQTDEALARLAEENPPSAEEAETLATRKGEIENEREALLKRMGEIDAALNADRKARTTQAEHLQKIEALETEARPWMVLKDLIGSADGSKFAKFAQGLTLGQLVNLANRHLLTLNPRYEIQRVQGQDLELEIIDRYQADAIRPTQSLSGGESFLVSLALALGLSEMAGQKTRIESLFIDEGFGSLDADTLDTALAALENLRLENRTIGVISHVELLKSRLGTQIEVTRKADGHATLNVVDG